MERLYILAPALLGVAFMLVMLAIYSVLCAVGRTPKVTALKHNQLFGPYMARYLVWLLGPVERLARGRISPNAITTLSLAGCVGAGVAAAYGHLATAAWVYALAGILDILDGRLARSTGTMTAAGALFDSVSDRWGELAVLTGFAWYLRDSTWLLAVILAIAGSMMVSYTRARAEGLGLTLTGGMMQRAERIVLVGVGSIVGAWFAATPDAAHHAQTAVGLGMLLTGLGASITALGRWRHGYRVLVARERAAAPMAAPVMVSTAPSSSSSRIPVVTAARRDIVEAATPGPSA
ncbi:MAG: CDP-alcohol phosphatidyltransferase family protein [Kofleriaceae bacterium]